MADAGIALPQQAIAVLEERHALWTQHDAARATAGRLTTLGQQIGPSGPVAALPAASESHDPPGAVRATVNELERTLQEITALTNRIQSSHAEIEQIQQHASQMKITLIAVGVVAVIVLLLIVTHL